MFGVLGVLALLGCQGHGPTSADLRASSLTLTPATTALTFRQSVRFTPTLHGLDDPRVTWRTTGGSIADGLFTASDTPGTFTVTATSVADPTVSGTARVTVQAGGAAITLQ